MSESLEYVHQNKDRFLEELMELLRIPSVSADPKYKADVNRAAEYICEKLQSAGADNVEVCSTTYYYTTT